MKLYVELDSTVITTNEPDSNDEWDRGCTETDWVVKGISRTDSAYPSRVIDVYYDPEPGTYYLVFAVYSTGDSFGHDEKSSLEIFDIYKTLEEAKACKDTLEKANDFSEMIITSTGKKFKTSIPWHGYFEHLNYIEIMPVLI